MPSQCSESGLRSTRRARRRPRAALHGAPPRSAPPTPPRRPPPAPGAVARPRLRRCSPACGGAARCSRRLPERERRRERRVSRKQAPQNTHCRWNLVKSAAAAAAAAAEPGHGNRQQRPSPDSWLLLPARVQRTHQHRVARPERRMREHPAHRRVLHLHTRRLRRRLQTLDRRRHIVRRELTSLLPTACLKWSIRLASGQRRHQANTGHAVGRNP
eukprot:COSAG04_NODE_491_length_13463_cov_5.877432_8_plen_215_part_00